MIKLISQIYRYNGSYLKKHPEINFNYIIFDPPKMHCKFNLEKPYEYDNVTKKLKNNNNKINLIVNRLSELT